MSLRAFRPDDARAFHALMQIPEVTRLSNWPDAPTVTECENDVARMSEAFSKGTGCSWVVEDRGTGCFIGAIRYNYFIRDWFCGGIGYELHPDWWGQGRMTEALRTVVGCGHDLFGLNRMEAWTLPGNLASARALEKCGFRFEGVLRQRAWFKGRFHDFHWFGRVAADPFTETP
nr:GNAT family N-acetyltransferase [Azospirillum sp. B510]